MTFGLQSGQWRSLGRQGVVRVKGFRGSGLRVQGFRGLGFRVKGLKI